MSSITIKHLLLALILLVYSLASFSSPRIGSRLNHPPTMNGDQVFAGVKNQTLHFVLSGASDIDKNSLSYVLVDSPSNGTLKNCLNNTSVLNCEFIPSPEYRGTVSFSYKAFDGTSYSINSNKVILKIDLDNHAPSTGSNQDFSLKNDKAFKFSLSKANDPDSDVIFYQLVSHDGSGTLKNCLNGTSSIECEYIPASGINETVNITYKVSDGLIDSSQNASIKLRVGNVNHAPVMKGDQGFGTTKFTLAGASDEDKDTLTYSLVSPATLPELKNCLNGTSNLNCEYIPATKGKGSLAFTYKANDGKEDSTNVSKVTINYDSGSTPTNNSPVADIACIINGSSIHCDAGLSYDTDGTIVDYAWSFGDGKYASGVSVDHSYDQSGSYLATLKIKDNLGAETQKTQSIIISPNSLPIALFACTQKSHRINCTSTSSDADGSVTKTEWLINGQFLEGQSISYLFPSDGEYSVKMTVWDNGQAYSTIDKVYSLKNIAPIAKGTCSSSLKDHLSCEAFGSSDEDGVIASYIWEVNSKVISSSVSFDDLNLETSDKYLVKLTVLDEVGASSSETFEVVNSSQEDEEVDEIPSLSNAYFSPENFNTQQFQALDGTIAFILNEGTLSTSMPLSITINGVSLYSEKYTVLNGRVELNSSLVDGQNEIQISGYDTDGKEINSTFVVWAGSRTIDVFVSDSLGATLTAPNAEVLLVENQSVKAPFYRENEKVVFYNIPQAVSLSAIARDSNGAFSEKLLTKDNYDKTIELSFFNESLPSVPANNDFSNELQGWSLIKGTAVVSEDILAASKDIIKTLDLTPDSKGDLRLAHSFYAQQGNNSVSIRLKARSVGGESLISVMLNNKTTGEFVYKVISLNKLIDLNDSNAIESSWFDADITTSGGEDLIEVFISNKVSTSKKSRSSSISLAPINEASLYIKDAKLKNNSFNLNAENINSYDISGISLGKISSDYFNGNNRLHLYLELLGNDIYASSYTLVIQTADKKYLRSIPFKLTNFVVSSRSKTSLKGYQVIEIPSEDADYKTLPPNVYISLNVKFPSGKTIDKILYKIKSSQNVLSYFPVMVDLSPNFSKANRYSKRDLEFGGDAWTTVSMAPNVMKVLSADPLMQFNDISRMNGGDWPKHIGHKVGTGIDMRWAGSEFENNSGKLLPPFIYQTQTADKMLSFIKNDKINKLIDKALVSYCGKNTDSDFFKKISSLQNKVVSDVKTKQENDHDCQTALTKINEDGKLTYQAVHFNHFHLELKSNNDSNVPLSFKLRSSVSGVENYLYEFDSLPSSQSLQLFEGRLVGETDFKYFPFNESNPTTRTLLKPTSESIFFIKAIDSNSEKGNSFYFLNCSTCLCGNNNEWGILLQSKSSMFISLLSSSPRPDLIGGDSSSVCGKSSINGFIKIDDTIINESDVVNKSGTLQKISSSSIKNSKVLDFKVSLHSAHIKDSTLKDTFSPNESYLIGGTIIHATLEGFQSSWQDGYISYSHFNNVLIPFASTNTITSCPVFENINFSSSTQTSFMKNNFSSSYFSNLLGWGIVVNNTVKNDSLLESINNISFFSENTLDHVTLSSISDLNFSKNTITNTMIRNIKGWSFFDNTIENASDISDFQNVQFARNTIRDSATIKNIKNSSFTDNIIEQGATVQNIEGDFKGNTINNAFVEKSKMEGVVINRGAYKNKSCVQSTVPDENNNYVLCVEL